MKQFKEEAGALSHKIREIIEYFKENQQTELVSSLESLQELEKKKLEIVCFLICCICFVWEFNVLVFFRLYVYKL